MNTPASEIQGLFDTDRDGAMNDSTGSAAFAVSDAGGASGIGGEEDADESFDMLANMPPTPVGGLVAPSSSHAAGGRGGGGDGSVNFSEESLAHVLGIPGSSPTTPAAVAQQGAPSPSPSVGRLTGRNGGAAAGVRGVGGVTPGGGRVGIKTPYSSRRSAHRPSVGQAAFPRRTFTPGTASRGGDGDDANASFMWVPGGGLVHGGVLMSRVCFGRAVVVLEHMQPLRFRCRG